ncbi:receptor protein kinase [Salix suchowensis]|nr:receptor protein kinase [Salix suchowensis]
MFFYRSVLFLSLLFTARSLNQDGLFLQRVKLGLSDPAHSLSSWNERDDTPCNWYGITCDNSTHRVSSVDLSSSELMGPFPNFLCRLPFLTLDLSANLLVGSIPASLSELSNLKLLNLASNNFSGAIPPKFGQFQKLELISLAGNLLTGSIPSELGNISTLQHLLQFGNLSNLVELWLANCNLVGPIPESLSKLTRLSNLDFSLNRLTGSIPSWLTGLKNIEQIELYQNFLSGELPLGFSNLTMLRRFDALVGTLPEGIAKSPNLYELKLFNNELTGELPSQLGLNSPLKWLDVSYNGFSGNIPGSLCAKGELEDLILIYNSFSGRVRLRNNRFTGIVPEQFWGLPQVYFRIASAYILSVLKISKNQFSGSLPMEIGYLGKLIEFSASDNMFTGPIPGSLVNLSTLSMLVLEDNELSGGLPHGIQGWKSLNELNLANNKLSGQIPDEIGSLQALNYLDLSGNYFSGKIPTQLEDLNLNQLNLSNNMLSGAIPPFYAKEMYRSSFMGNPGLCGDLKDLCPQEGDSRKQSYLWILRSTFILAAMVFVVGVVWFYFKYQNFKKEKEVITISKWRSFHKIGFSEFEILDFLKEDNVIGSGASGKVYKAVLSNGETVAVKKLSGESRKDTTNHSSEKDEFEAEVETLGRIRHKNIVRLWCCCNTADCKLLVYEYMPNGSLGDFLHGSKGGSLDWPTRYKIALDAAEGLSYLHHDCVPPIVHRDVKSNNILLDAEFGARVADFGVAKAVQGVNNRGAESMSVIAGSCGYIAPEYAYTLRVNEKSDIYSFGVVILELVTGRLPVDPEFGEKDLVKWVCATWIKTGWIMDEVSKILEIGLRCTTSFPIGRPSMRLVVKMLQEAGGMGHKPEADKNDEKPSPCYREEVSDQGSLV